MKSITITREQFRDVIMKAADEWDKIGEKQGREKTHGDLIMFLQNIAFGGMISQMLFDGKEVDDATDNEE